MERVSIESCDNGRDMESFLLVNLLLFKYWLPMPAGENNTPHETTLHILVRDRHTTTPWTA